MRKRYAVVGLLSVVSVITFIDRMAIALWVVMGMAAALPRAPLGLARLRRRTTGA